MSLIFLKLGGSAITDKTRDATPKPDVIRDAARAVKTALAQDHSMQLLLGHGSGSFGHYTASKYGFGKLAPDRSQSEIWRAYAETGAAAQRLNRLVTDIFLDEGVPVVSLQPSASARLRGGELVALETANVQTALDHQLVPLVFGDVAFDDTRGMAIASTDALFEYLAARLRPARILYATAVNGIFTADPNKHPDAELIREITPQSLESIRAHVGEAHGVDVTGGMLDKLARSVSLVTHFPNLRIQVISARYDALLAALCDANDSHGTRIHSD